MRALSSQSARTSDQLRRSRDTDDGHCRTRRCARFATSPKPTSWRCTNRHQFERCAAAMTLFRDELHPCPATVRRFTSAAVSPRAPRVEGLADTYRCRDPRLCSARATAAWLWALTPARVGARHRSQQRVGSKSIDEHRDAVEFRPAVPHQTAPRMAEAVVRKASGEYATGYLRHAVAAAASAGGMAPSTTGSRTDWRRL